MPRKNQITKKVDYSFKLGDRVFPVKPFFESEDSYNKGTEFLVLATPIIMKILSALLGGLTPTLTATEQEQLRSGIAEAIQPNALPETLEEWEELLTHLILILLRVLEGF